MCENPGRRPDGTEFACRKCWQCSARRIDDWVGRCIAETKTAVASHSITLTYGRDENDEQDHIRAAWLTYSDVQKMFKKLRRHGYKYRYLVAGEYGSTKGRAHWHMLIFWYPNGRKDKRAVPPHELSRRNLEKRFHNDYWPHGYQHWEEPTRTSIRYVCKYIQKDVGKDERQANLHMSKKPPLGHVYFCDLARKYVEQGLAPQNLIYSFPDVIDPRTGKRREYWMSGATAHNFLEEYKALWARHKGGFHPYSELIEEHDDKAARAIVDPDWKPDPPKGTELKPAIGCYGPYSGIDPRTGKRGFYSVHRTGRHYWYRHNPVNRKNWSDYEWQRETDAEMIARPKRKQIGQ